jgi:hypothetical protein
VLLTVVVCRWPRGWTNPFAEPCAHCWGAVRHRLPSRRVALQLAGLASPLPAPLMLVRWRRRRPWVWRPARHPSPTAARSSRLVVEPPSAPPWRRACRGPAGAPWRQPALVACGKRADGTHREGGEGGGRLTGFSSRSTKPRLAACPPCLPTARPLAGWRLARNPVRPRCRIRRGARRGARHHGRDFHASHCCRAAATAAQPRGRRCDGSGCRARKGQRAIVVVTRLCRRERPTRRASAWRATRRWQEGARGRPRTLAAHCWASVAAAAAHVLANLPAGGKGGRGVKRCALHLSKWARDLCAQIDGNSRGSDGFSLPDAHMLRHVSSRLPRAGGPLRPPARACSPFDAGSAGGVRLRSEQRAGRRGSAPALPSLLSLRLRSMAGTTPAAPRPAMANGTC